MYADEADTDSIMLIAQVANTYASPGFCLISCVDET